MVDMKYTPPKGGSGKRPSAHPSSTLSSEKIKGIFSTQSVVKVGTGTTTRRTIQKTYWHAQELDEGSLEIQPLNRNYIPSGPKRKVSKDDFLQKFSPEPEFYVTTVFPKMKELTQTIERGEKHRKQGASYSAEFEFGQAVKVDEENVRANFGLGLTYMDRGEKGKANDIFERLVKLDAAFEKEHKHLFNDFGINLRKNRMFDQAIEYYERALKLTQQDEHLYCNIARAYYEKGDIRKCVDNLKKAVKLNSEMEEVRQFWDYLHRKKYISEEYPGSASKTGNGSRAASGGGSAKSNGKKEKTVPETSHKLEL
ncbi:MAG: tetratricopeptide repeat protein [Desulfovibrio sp.]|uniref:tetratricopeptide repeat protein n=1 Tax=Desulfovibrio sp. 7SRBS1 TaxID=3378064 RepID=UPI003B3CDAAC